MSFVKHKSRTLSECYQAIRDGELINDNNIFTTRTPFGYIVTHYTTPVAALLHGRWYRSKTYYSNTTSRVLNGIFDALDVDSIDVVEGDLKKLIDGGSL